MKKLLSVLVLTLFVSTTSFAQEQFKYLVPEGETLIEENETYNGLPADDYMAIFGVMGELILNNVTFKNNEPLAIALGSDAFLKIGDASSFISNKNGAIINVTGNLEIGNNVEFNSNQDYSYGISTIHNYGGLILIKNNVKFLNNTCTNNGGAISNDFIGETTIFQNAQFINNKAYKNGGAIYNGISDSSDETNKIIIYRNALFDSNSAENGGAIYNCSVLGILGGAKFINNTADTGYGGAIYNCHALELWADCGDIEFTGNKANGVSNAIYDSEGQIGMLTTYGSNIIFNDRITSKNENSIMRISGSGKIILNEDMSGYNGTVTLDNGSTLELGKNGKIFSGNLVMGDTYGSATLNLINEEVNNYLVVRPNRFSGNALLEIDATLLGNNSTGDTFSPRYVDEGSEIVLTNVNITNTSITNSTGTFNVVLIDNILNDYYPKLNVDLKVTQHGKTVKFTKNPTSLNGTDVDYTILNQTQTLAQVISDTTSCKVYNLSNNESLSQNLSSLEGDQLIINGNGYDITSNNKKGMSVGTTDDYYKILKLENVKTISGFFGNYGAVVDNYGTTRIGSNTTFENNNAVGRGGVFTNYSNRSSISIGHDVTFRNNSAGNSGGVIYNSEWLGTILFGANAKFESNTATNLGGAISNNGSIEFAKNPTFISNQAKNGGAIYNDEKGDITFKDGAKFINNKNSAIHNNEGTLDFFAISEDVEFTGNDVAIFDNKGTIRFENDGANIIFNDKLVSYSSDSNLFFLSNTSNFLDRTEDTSKTILNADMSEYTGKITIDTYLQLGKNGTLFNSNSKYKIYNATMDLANSVLQDYEFSNSLEVVNILNLKVDADLNNEKMDTITAHNILCTGEINVTAINVTKDTDKKEEISLEFITGEDLKAIVESVDKAYSVMYEYDASYDKETGNMSFVRGKENPISNESAVSGLASGYLSEVTIANQSFANIDNKVSQTRAATKTPLYASANTNQVFEQNGSIERALWLRPYVVSDTVDVGTESKVDNTMYGTLAGIDLPAGKDKLLSFYLGYTGGKQEFGSVKMNQTNYILGVTGSLIKDKWYLGATVNAGTNKVTADNDLGSDDIDNITYSVGVKTGYDFDLGKNFTLQPNIILMYIGLTSSDFTNAQGNKIEDDGINNILIQPGVRLDLSLTNGWTPYGLFDVAINTGETSTKINGNKVKSLELDPYFEYGVGVSKDFLNSPWSCYGQVSGKSGSRSGAGFNLGIKYAF